jgi:hypothetical protein
MSGRYKGISDEEIIAGLSKGHFFEEGVRQVRDDQGRFVKHIKQPGHENSRLPASVIQIHHNYVYQADLRPFIDALIHARTEALFEDMGDRYELVLTKLERYINHRKGLEDLVVASNDASTIFQKRVQPLLAGFAARDPDSSTSETLINMLKAFINLQFIYLIATFWLDRQSVSNDTAIPRRISDLEGSVQLIFEQLLAFQHGSQANGFVLRDSLYAKYFLQGGKGVYHLEKFLNQDSRFQSLTAFLGMVTNRFLSYNGEKDWNGYHVGEASYEIDFTIDQIPFEDDKRHVLACGFSSILSDINQLWNVYDELKGAGSIEPEDIQLNPGPPETEGRRVTAIQLKLPKTNH